MERYCNKCGNPIPEGANECPVCDPAMPEEPTAPFVSTEFFEDSEPCDSCEPYARTDDPSLVFESPVTPVESGSDTPTKKKKVKWWMIVAPIAAVLLIAAILVGIFWNAILLRLWPAVALSKAFANTVSDLNSRGEGTLGQELSDIMDEEGMYTSKLDFNFNYGAYMSADLSVTGANDLANNRSLSTLNGGLNILFYTYDLDAAMYMDSECWAVNWAQATGDTYYGIVYDTFEEDMLNNEFLSDAIGEDTLSAISAYLDRISEAMEEYSYDAEFEINEEYINILVDFLLERKGSVDSEEIELNGSLKKCDTITYTVSDEELAVLLADLLQVAQEDGELKNLIYSGEVFQYLEDADEELESFWDAFFDGCYDLLDELEASDGLSSLTFYLYNDRVARFAYTYENSEDEVELSLTLGENAAEDDIIFSCVTDIDQVGEEIRIIFSQKVEKELVRQSIRLEVKDDSMNAEGTVSYEWDKQAGDLTLDITFVNGEYSWDYSCSMGLYEEDGGMVFELPELISLLESIVPEVSAELEGISCEMTCGIYPGAQIQTPDFVNIRDLGEDTIDDILENISDNYGF